jgi:hypothetical protein
LGSALVERFFALSIAGFPPSRKRSGGLAAALAELVRQVGASSVQT